MSLFDLHVHAAPDVLPRWGDDLQIAETYQAAGFVGGVLKAHYGDTVGRAAAAARHTGLAFVGGIALNRHVGGINPAAAAAACQAGARIIWFPTADAAAQVQAGLPRLDEPTTNAITFQTPPRSPNAAAPALRVLEIAGEHDVVVATGHLSTPECVWVIRQARDVGLRKLLLTHPSYTVPAMSARDVKALTRLGALAEITAYQLLHQPGMTAARLAHFIGEVGLEHVVLSSDAGQPESPAPPDALELLIDELTQQGLDRQHLIAAASDRPRQLVLV